MAVNAKKLLNTVAEKPPRPRGNIHLYLHKELYKEFKKKCGTISATKVLEQFMREFIESAKKN